MVTERMSLPGLLLTLADISLYSGFIFLYHRDAQILFHSAILIFELYRLHLNNFNRKLRRMVVKYAQVRVLLPERALRTLQQFNIEHTRLTEMVHLNNQDLVSRILLVNFVVLIPNSVLPLYRLLYTPLTPAESLGTFTVWFVDFFLYIATAIPVARGNKSFYTAIRYLPPLQWKLPHRQMGLKLKYETLASRLMEGEIKIGFYIGEMKVVSFATLFEVQSCASNCILAF